MGDKPGATGCIMGRRSMERHTFMRDVTNKQQPAGIQATGKLFDLPAGAVNVAVGGEYRRDSLHVIADAFECFDR
ncbi:hypothetical protein SAMN06297144_2028 [Sphingomonas guangdongensis]|uniref:Uncharacterized protein n=1 Tax=Sphingomonas guangdongensis TaxID=1141890 RepID=A0A285R3I2_9SPHN|nr:hypothetical protein [Sphingomonas guangdongensis]SOB86917.1 hypothetical protein SAMN06297144_2028 [Sphingomonas guangdongensis]